MHVYPVLVRLSIFFVSFPLLINFGNHVQKKMGAYSEDECKEGPIDPWGNDEDAILDNGDKVTSVLTEKVSLYHYLLP